MEVDEQRVCIKFCVRLGKTGSETFEMLKQAFGDSCMSRSRTFEWFGRFKNGRTSTANDDRSGTLLNIAPLLFYPVLVNNACLLQKESLQQAYACLTVDSSSISTFSGSPNSPVMTNFGVGLICISHVGTEPTLVSA